MATKIRLQRHGRKGRPIFHIVVADSRAKRDGKYIERLGIYNPNTDPATIDINFDHAVDWVMKGAQPTDTARAILSYKGVLMKKHLLNGVQKGAFDEAEAEKRFDAWMDDKVTKIEGKKESLSKQAEEKRAQAIEAEKEANKAREAALAEANAPAVVEEEPSAKASGSEGEDKESSSAEATGSEGEAIESSSAKASEDKEEPSAKASGSEAEAEAPAPETATDEPKAEEAAPAEEVTKDTKAEKKADEESAPAEAAEAKEEKKD